MFHTVSSMPVFFGLITLAFFATVSQAVNQTCYYPDGSEAYGRTPCDSAAKQSHCCSPNDLCLSNGYCWGYGDSWANRLIRDGCTDPSWKDPACPAHCQGFDGTVASTARTILMIDDSPQGKFCCVASVKNASANTGYNNVTNKCGYIDSPSGSYAPFVIGEGLAISNRSDGSWTNTTTFVHTTSGGDVVAVGAGVGVTLGVLWLATLALLIWKWKQAAIYRKHAATARDSASSWTYAGVASEKHMSELSPNTERPSEMAVEPPVGELDVTK